MRNYREKHCRGARERQNPQMRMNIPRCWEINQKAQEYDENVPLWLASDKMNDLCYASTNTGCVGKQPAEKPSELKLDSSQQSSHQRRHLLR